VVGFSGTTVADPDRYALEVLATVLSGQGGRLFVELRDRRGLAYRISAFSLEGVDPGYVAVYMATSPANVEAALAGIEEELDKVRSRKVDRSELERAQKYLVGSHEISLQRRAALASTIAFHECYGQGYGEYLRYAGAVLGTTADDLMRVARKYLDPGRALRAIVRPQAKPDQAATRVARAARAD
jgi:zinc protease